MNPQRHIFNLLILILSVSIFISCSGKVAGGAGGTEVENGISGILVKQDGKAFALGKVYLVDESKPVLKIKSTSNSNDWVEKPGQSASSGIRIDSTLTNAEGYYQFNHVNPGNYIIEAQLDENQSIRIEVTKEIGNVALGTRTLASNLDISGTILPPDDFKGSVHITILETQDTLTLEQGVLDFDFTGLAPGDYTFQIIGLVPERDTVLIQKSITSNTQTIDLLLGESHFFDFNLQINYPDSVIGKIRLKLTELSREWEIENQSDVLLDSLPTGVYALDIEGIDPQRLPIQTMITISNDRSVNNSMVNVGERYLVNLKGQVKLPEGTRGTSQVELKELGIVQTTDSNGLYLFENVPIGMYTLSASGVLPKRKAIDTSFFTNVQNLDTITIDFQLTEMSVIIVDGRNTHDWARLSKHTKTILEESGLFNVTISTTPSEYNEDLWYLWQPNFHHYDVIHMNYNGGRSGSLHQCEWPDTLKQQFEDFISEGGGLFINQGSATYYTDWPNMNQMMGLGWSNSVNEGKHVELDSNGNITTLRNEGEGPSFSRGTPLDSLVIIVKNSTHPLAQGLPRKWKHTRDDIDVDLRGPVNNLEIISFIADFRVPDNHEPVEWTTIFGKGRIYVNMMVDLQPTRSNLPVRCVGFQTQLIRSSEWLAKGTISHQVPANFPTEGTTSENDNISLFGF